eukprot:1801958-Rhodomonas_salina.2
MATVLACRSDVVNEADLEATDGRERDLLAVCQLHPDVDLRTPHPGLNWHAGKTRRPFRVFGERVAIEDGCLDGCVVMAGVAHAQEAACSVLARCCVAVVRFGPTFVLVEAGDAAVCAAPADVAGALVAPRCVARAPCIGATGVTRCGVDLVGPSTHQMLCLPGRRPEELCAQVANPFEPFHLDLAPSCLGCQIRAGPCLGWGLSPV